MENLDCSLIHFIESASIDHRLLRKAESSELRESLQKCPVKLRESVDTDANGWWVPVSFYNKKNGNGRIYGKELWENVINNQRETWVGAPMLADHPSGDSDGSPKDICGVWLDAKMDKPNRDGIGLVYGLLMPSGTLGRDLKDHLSNGLKIGTSSSGFGRLMSDGCTVYPNTYTIERLSDWVLNPSQGTFFAYDESDDDIEDRSIRESNETENKIQKNTIKENVVKDSSSKLTKLEEKVFRRNMESFLESASKIEDPQERLNELNDIKSYLEEGACSDLKEKVEQKIAEEEAFIATALKEKIELKNELNIESTKDLKEKLTKIVEDAQVLDQEAKDWKKISEKLQSRYSEASKELKSRPTVAYVEFLKEKNEKINSALNESSKKSETIIKDLTSAYKALKEENQKTVNSLAESTNKVSALEKQVESLNFYGNNVSLAKRKLEKDATVLNEKIGAYESSIDNLQKTVESQRAHIEKLTKEADSLRESLAKKDEIVKVLMKEARQSQLKVQKVANLVERKSKEESSTEITDYYDSLYEAYGNAIVPYEKTIKGCLTLAEAKKVFYTRILQKLPESVEISNLLMSESLYTDADKKAEVLKGTKFERPGIVDRLPKGWL